MSEFVNYKKRSITLPPGCKNLIDVLQRPRNAKAHDIIAQDELPAVMRGESGTLKLSEIGQYVAMPFQTHARAFILMLSLPDERLTVDFTEMDGELMAASATFEENAHREVLMREFFSDHDLQVPGDDWTPAQFVPGVPVQFIYRILPLPSDTATASKLATELFRHVCGLSDESQLIFRYYEIAKAA